MDEVKGVVIGTRTQSPLHKERHLLEIELDKRDVLLLNWQDEKVLIKKI